MLVPLKEHGVSMTRFESRPARSGQWEYYFYIDLQGHPDQPHVAAALQELRERVRVLQAARHLSRRRPLEHHSMFNQLGVIGCGLMGGSFALALKRAGLVKRVIGYSKSPSTTEQAKRLGVIDAAAESALLAVSGSDIVLIAVPVAATEATFKAIRHLVEPGVLFMDVGSTKRDVVDAARRVLKDRIASFVPAHPIAGKEVAGIGHADAALYQGRQVILTPLPQDLARAGAEGDRRLGGDRLAGAAHDAGEPRRRLRRRQPPAAPAGLRLLQLGRAPAGRARLPVARRARAFATSRASPPATRRSGATS